jgi:hypothetical protein
MQKQKTDLVLLQIYNKQQGKQLSLKLIRQELGLQMAKPIHLNNRQQAIFEKRIQDNEAEIEKLNQRLDQLALKLKEIEAIIEGRAKVVRLIKSGPPAIIAVNPRLVSLKLIAVNTPNANAGTPHYHLPSNADSESQ